jgi:hypothetical protein
MKDSTLRGLLATVPAIATALYVLLGHYLFMEPIGDLFFNRYNAIIYTYILLASLTPFAVYEYMKFHYIRSIEYEIPVFLSVLEATITAGMSFFAAFSEAGKYTKFLGRIVDNIIKKVRAGLKFDEEINAIPAETFLLKVFREYLRMLSRSGEELYVTLAEYRQMFEKILSFKTTLYNQARQTMFVFLTILYTYVLTIIIIAKFFLEALVGKATTIITVSSDLVNLVESISVYTLFIQAVGSGVALSIISGSSRIHMLLITIAGSVIGLLVYAAFIFGVIPAERLIGI